MDKRRNSSSRGFTLVELMIVVVIIGLLASIAIPKFSMVIARSKLTEMKRELWRIINIETAYYYINDEYIGFGFGEDSPLLGFDQTENSRFTYSFIVADETAYGKEDGAANDINFDEDGDDGLSVTIGRVEGVTNGSAGDNFAW